ncbi:transferrin-binding protein-like solute binding protein [Martelella mediterranea]|uniref:Transferrin binding protein-like solute binding protein n=1 Tax=Martelella mediterranea DSM 17316 TaxID=1122214 RepID=A0A1U9YXC3_9HYPH|nr:transferrin-binding protein-like solute binding protein [Martelella mediterranea]AQZ50093.1 Transferrin binding protein-like solute binding protein [Martelella mediterranea DSM 17316]
MKYTFVKLTGTVGLAAIAGCSGGGGGGPVIAQDPGISIQTPPPSVDPGYYQDGEPRKDTGEPSNATGFAAVSAYPKDWESGSSRALIQTKDDGYVSIKIAAGPLAGQEFILPPLSPDGTSDAASEYMRVLSEDGQPLVAVIDAERGNYPDSFLYAYRFTEGLTENMPVSGKAKYQGTAFGYSAVSFGTVSSQEGTFSAEVDFASSSLQGNISTGGRNAQFDGAITGSTFSSDSLPAGSKVEGAFYGDNASSMGGTYLFNGDNEMIGGFTASRGPIQP